MTVFWTSFIVVIVAFSIAATALLLWWTGRKRPGDPAADSTSHIWDGDLTEYNKPMPRWWINLFYLTILFALGYLAWYPGLGAFAGKGGWSSRGQLALEQAEADKMLAATYARFDGKAIDVIARDPAAIVTGRRVYANNCAMCHGSDARGGKGFPNLTDDKWQWGGSPEQILATVLDGRQAAMPVFAPMLGGEAQINETAVYVQSLSGQSVSAALAQPGRAHFEGICAACHGIDGKGNPALGSADLTDDYWLYGDRFEDIRAAITGGHNGQMPAHRNLIGETRSRLAAAYVYSLSHPEHRGDHEDDRDKHKDKDKE